ncbi:hypothetical protein MBM_06935 [Drepanopeziza brunnea f. sp. 'multigermtubi' MB_m1]|uniref:Uncharacterized protein n=1 Tax=Marssonina brunnea f. sp. multigermtubi (strain MB_m1) TaxID=1072389 RepID=K1XQ91_MARBU|nr:uncharacterized protein MBM_06935 [Drepanopeziza brunnea f. sp. 'multigermtubi' MB_m1]EKD14724.1 hypothetical protein MBM_06935 [Drepanopeziza brunnea f. sp. 'multigermtubi' MB_m1]
MSSPPYKSYSHLTSSSSPSCAQSQQHYDNDNSNTTHDQPSSPTTTLSSYTREMHLHTKRQMEAASRSARRRSGNAHGVGSADRVGWTGVDWAVYTGE